MQIIRHSSLTATPWKNGGGITREVVRVPDGGGAFRWRVSMAEIDRPGPFSDFTGYRRIMVLLQGGGVRLQFGDGQVRVLREIGDCAQFDGALAAHCDLLEGRCIDLNLMVAESAGAVRAWVEGLGASTGLENADALTLVFPLTGAVSVQTPGADARYASDQRLDAWDLLVVRARERAQLSPIRARDGAAPMVFFATLADVNAD